MCGPSQSAFINVRLLAVGAFRQGRCRISGTGLSKNDGGIKKEFESSESVINVGQQPVARA